MKRACLVNRFVRPKNALRQVSYVFIFCFFSHALTAQSAENGNTQWPNGVQSVTSALLPAPGDTEFYSYIQTYHADKFKDSNGDSKIPGFQLNVTAMVGRVVHTWDQTLGGWNLSTGALAAANSVDVHAFGTHDDTAGLNYLFLTPLYFTYQMDDLHFLFGPGLFIPAGRFDKNRSANASFNYYAYTQEMAVTYMPNPRLEISVQSNLTINGKNHDTDYRSGNVIDTDFNVNYSFFKDLPQLQFGLTGFYTQQFQDDEYEGEKVGDGNRLRKFAVGPQVLWYFNQKAGVALKWQHEFDVRNGPEGDKLWLQFAFPL